MQIQGVTLEQFNEIVEIASKHAFSDNVTTHFEAHETHRGVVARLRVSDTRGPGSRVSASGRHGPWACWHAYREVLRWLFYFYPDAIVRTAMATYKGFMGFMEHYPHTANMQIGGKYPADLCDCDVMQALDWELAAEQIGNWRTTGEAMNVAEDMVTDAHRALREAEAVLS